MDFTAYLPIALQAALAAGQEIMRTCERTIEVNYKENRSPLTDADRESNRVISEILGTGIPVLSEEGRDVPFTERRHWDLFWLVDPLDGTKEFIKRNGEFTVNIALVNGGSPILGVVYAPALKRLYWGASGKGAFLADAALLAADTDPAAIVARSLPISPAPLPQTYTIVASRSHMSPETEAFIRAKEALYGTVELLSAGSSLKLCLVAAGDAHIYPRLAPTMEWDTAAGHAIAAAAGCRVYDARQGTDLKYNKEHLLNPWFIAENNTGTGRK